MATLSVMAVSRRHPVLCCARYCTDIPCTEDFQDDVNSHEASGAQTHRGEAWGKARPDSCSPKSQVILCTSACPFSPSPPVGSDISVRKPPRAAQSPMLKVPVCHPRLGVSCREKQDLERLLWAPGKGLRAMRLTTQWMWNEVASSIKQPLARQLRGLNLRLLTTSSLL